MQNKFKIILFSVILILLSTLVMADAKESIAEAASAFEKGDLEGANKHATQLVFDIIDQLNLVRWTIIIIGFIAVIFIVKKLSDFMSKPRVNRKQLKKDKEDSKFREMFKEKQNPIESLKDQLGGLKKK